MAQKRILDPAASELTTKEKVDERLKQIESKLESISNSDEFKQYLKVMANFHQYSLNNTMLIGLQKPDATQVAGFNTWKAMGRNVKKGEKGLDIFIPMFGKRKFINKEMFKDSPRKLDKFLAGYDVELTVAGKDKKQYTFSTNVNRFKTEDIPDFLAGKTIKEESSFVSFKLGKVFDISQTDGAPLPEPPIKTDELKGTVTRYDDIMAAIRKISPSPITFGSSQDYPNLKSAYGYFVPSENKIVVRDSLSQLHTLKTTIHEVAHSILHNTEEMNKLPPALRPDKRDKEIQAESVACTTCYYFGIDTSDYSFGYIAAYASANPEKFKASMNIIKDASAEIIDSVDRSLYPEKYAQKEEIAAKAKERAQKKKLEHSKNKKTKATQSAEKDER